MNTRWLLTPQAILITLLVGACLMRAASGEPIYGATEYPFTLRIGAGDAHLHCTGPNDCTVIHGISKEPDGCKYDRETFNAIRHQSRLARQAGRHDKATILDFSAAILRCQPEDLEQKLAEAMSEVWNQYGH